MLGAERLTQRPIEEQLKKATVREITLKDGTVLQGFAITQTFWEMAKADRALERCLENRTKGYRTLEGKNRNIQVADRYIEDPKTTLESCGESLGINNRQNAQRIIIQTLEFVHGFTSEAIQKQFPLESLWQRKPIGVERIAARDNKTNSILALIKEGKTPAEIKQHGITPEQLQYAMGRLRLRGEQLPYRIMRPEELEALAKNLQDPNKTIEEYQDLLDSVTSSARRNRLVEKGVILPLRSLLLAGENPNPRSLKSIAEFLKKYEEGKDRVAVGEKNFEMESGPKKRTYFFLRTIDAEKATNILRLKS